jgi:hypothetical protein
MNIEHCRTRALAQTRQGKDACLIVRLQDVHTMTSTQDGRVAPRQTSADDTGLITRSRSIQVGELRLADVYCGNCRGHFSITNFPADRQIWFGNWLSSSPMQLNLTARFVPRKIDPSIPVL